MTHFKNIASKLIIALLLAALCCMGGCSEKADKNAASQRSDTYKTAEKSEDTVTPDSNASEEMNTEKPASEEGDKQPSAAAGSAPKTAAPAEKPAAVTVPQADSSAAPREENPKPDAEAPPKNAEKDEKPSSGKLTCTLSVRCDTLLGNMQKLPEDKRALVPKDGVIYPEQTVVFHDGESVFNVLLREMKRNKIHMEFKKTPGYGSTYIEGIGNIYEFDCGELSGWTYRLNGEFPGVGCSSAKLCDGDRIEWLYTCNLGEDIGGFAAK